MVTTIIFDECNGDMPVFVSREFSVHERNNTYLYLGVSINSDIEEIDIYAGELFIVNKDDFKFRCRAGDKHEVVLLGIDLSFYEKLNLPLKNKTFNITRALIGSAEYNNLLISFKEILSTLTQKNDEQFILVKKTVTNIVLILAKNFSSYNNSLTTAKPGPVAKIVNFLDAHYNEQWNLNELAEMVGLSPSYLSRAFSEQIGVSISTYINVNRAKVSAELVISTDKRFEEIADECGFACLKTFYSYFRKQCGTTPLEYRKKHRSPMGFNKLKNNILIEYLKTQTFSSTTSEEKVIEVTVENKDIIERFINPYELFVNLPVDIDEVSFDFFSHIADFKNDTGISNLSINLLVKKLGSTRSNYRRIFDFCDKIAELGITPVIKIEKDLSAYLLMSYLKERYLSIDLRKFKFLMEFYNDFFLMERVYEQFEVISDVIGTKCVIFSGDLEENNFYYILDRMKDKQFEIEYVINCGKFVAQNCCYKVYNERSLPENLNYDGTQMSSYLVHKAITENNNNVYMLDLTEMVDDKGRLFSNQRGIICENGLKKASYYGLSFIHKIGHNVIYKKDNCIVTESNHSYYFLGVNNNANSPISFNVQIPFLEGKVLKALTKIGRSNGCNYEWWLKMGRPNKMFLGEESSVCPLLSITEVDYVQNREFITTLDPHEIVLIKFTVI